MFVLRFSALFAAAVVMMGAAGADAAEIDWRVKNRFRLWDQAQTTRRVVTLDELLDQVARARLPGDVEQAMLGFLATQPDLYQKAYWREGDETYDRDYLWPTTYAGRASLPAAAGRSCVWSIDVGAVTAVASPCEQWVDFEVPAVGRDSAVRRSVPASLSVRIEGGSTHSTRVEIRDRLIASVGDSFASGEGNPDRPMDLTRVTRRFDPVESEDGRSVIQTAWRSEWNGRWVGREDVIGRAGGARWWDQRCHRSFYSQHMVAALRYAAAHPQQATTFITFACSGAETYRGLLGRQARPPGYAGDRQAEPLRYPQVEVLAANLCPRRPGGLSRDSTRAGQARTYPYWDWRGGELRRLSVREWDWVCTNGIPRRVDALLVSVGGNDVGFGPVIQDALLPRPEELPADARLGRWVLDILRERQALRPDQAKQRITGALPENLDQLRGRVAELFGAGLPVFQSAYPNPLQDESGNLCGPGANRSSPAESPHSRALAAVGGFWPDAEVEEVRRWRMVIRQAEAETVQSELITPLDRALRDHIRESGGQWTLIDGFQPAFERRGWCATDPDDLLETLALPNWGDQGWRDWSPQDWDPYRPRMRLFRTPNDAAMTQQPEDPRRLLGPFSGLLDRRLSRRQEALLSAMSGSFHPTFEAHVIMGWSLGQALIETPLPD
jgi:hypothetical protein